MSYSEFHCAAPGIIAGLSLHRPESMSVDTALTRPRYTTDERLRIEGIGLELAELRAGTSVRHPTRRLCSEVTSCCGVVNEAVKDRTGSP